MLFFDSRHVFSDIRAYVCTSKRCGMLMFDSFTAWRSHEMDHRREWFCPLCNLLHHDKSKAGMHLTRDHGEFAGHHDIDMLLQTSSRPSEHLPADDCPFCDWGTILRERNHTPQEHDLTVPSKRFMKHLGRHLEEIALFVMPQSEEDIRSSGDTASNAGHAALDENSATASTLSSFKSQPSSSASASARHSGGLPSNEVHQDLCPFPTCGMHVKDLQGHMLTHQEGGSEKCPIFGCDRHTKGFARKSDKNRHLLTHYKGKLVCNFCPDSGTAAEKSFQGMKVFKIHLTIVHGVDTPFRNARRRSNDKPLLENTLCGVADRCSICGIPFATPRELYDHLDDCVLLVMQQQYLNNPSKPHPKLPDTIVRQFSHRSSKHFRLGCVFDVLYIGPVAQDTLARGIFPLDWKLHQRAA